MTKVLVVTASRHGATAEIGAAIANELEHRGIHATMTSPQDAPTDLGEYDAFVVGSAIYAGRWSREANEFIDDHREVLSRRPVWLFSSGPVGAIATGPDVPSEVLEHMSALDARSHRLFGGRLDRSRLLWWERVAARFVHAPEGDFRDWNDIESWADAIAVALSDTAVAFR